MLAMTYFVPLLSPSLLHYHRETDKNYSIKVLMDKQYNLDNGDKFTSLIFSEQA